MKEALIGLGVGLVIALFVYIWQKIGKGEMEKKSKAEIARLKGMLADRMDIESEGLNKIKAENEELKKEIFYISDEGYVFPNAVPLEMMRFYMSVYPEFQEKRFHELMSRFGLDEKRKISTFSKGMKKQLALIIGMCAGTRYLLCDETFDGLDPAMRQVIKALIAQEILDRAFTPVIASHNLRELEDICDTVGLLHEGGVILSKDLTELKMHMHKVQCLISDREKESALIQALDILEIKRQGTLLIITARGTREEIMAKIQEADPLFSEVIPLSLEEIFISETEVAGYDIRKFILG